MPTVRVIISMFLCLVACSAIGMLNLRAKLRQVPNPWYHGRWAKLPLNWCLFSIPRVPSQQTSTNPTKSTFKKREMNCLINCYNCFCMIRILQSVACFIRMSQLGSAGQQHRQQEHQDGQQSRRGIPGTAGTRPESTRQLWECTSCSDGVLDFPADS